MLIDLLLLTCIIVFVVDISGFVTELETMLAKWLKVRKCSIPKPISCSLCMTWWVGLFYLLVTSQFTLEGIAVVCVMSYLTTTIFGGLVVVKEWVDYLLQKLSIR